MKEEIRILVQFLGPRGGRKSRRTFSGVKAIKVIAAVKQILDDERQENKAEETKNGRCSRHSLRSKALKDEMTRWTCRRCKKSVEVKSDYTEFQAALSLAYREGKERANALNMRDQTC